MAERKPYECEYAKLGTKEGWLSSGGLVHEFFGTMFWIFLAGLVEVFKLGVGFQFGLAWVITSSVFDGHFNAFTTLSDMLWGGDALMGLVRLIVQMLAGLAGFHLFDFLGYDVSKAPHHYASSDLHWHDANGFAVGGIYNWLRLLVVLMVYYYASDKLKTGSGWLDTILLLGVTFALGGKNFAFAPNRVWFGPAGSWTTVASTFYYDYLAYGIMGFLAKYLLGIYDGDKTCNFTCPCVGN